MRVFVHDPALSAFYDCNRHTAGGFRVRVASEPQLAPSLSATSLLEHAELRRIQRYSSATAEREARARFSDRFERYRGYFHELGGGSLGTYTHPGGFLGALVRPLQATDAAAGPTRR